MQDNCYRNKTLTLKIFYVQCAFNEATVKQLTIFFCHSCQKNLLFPGGKHGGLYPAGCGKKTVHALQQHFLPPSSAINKIRNEPGALRLKDGMDHPANGCQFVVGKKIQEEICDD